MPAQTQVFDDGSTITTDDFGITSSTAATDRPATVNGSAGSPEWSGFWQGAARSVLSIGTDYARARVGLTGENAPIQAPARPAGAIRTTAAQQQWLVYAVLGLGAYLVFKK